MRLHTRSYALPFPPCALKSSVRMETIEFLGRARPLKLITDNQANPPVYQHQQPQQDHSSEREAGLLDKEKQPPTTKHENMKNVLVKRKTIPHAALALQ